LASFEASDSENPAAVRNFVQKDTFLFPTKKLTKDEKKPPFFFCCLLLSFSGLQIKKKLN